MIRKILIDMAATSKLDDVVMNKLEHAVCKTNFTLSLYSALLTVHSFASQSIHSIRKASLIFQLKLTNPLLSATNKYYKFSFPVAQLRIE